MVNNDLIREHPISSQVIVKAHIVKHNVEKIYDLNLASSLALDEYTND